MAKHQNKNDCEACLDILTKYPKLYPILKSWFITMRAKYNMLHCSEAGRGIKRQTLMHAEKKSRATYGASAHNWNAAIDTFIMIKGKDLYDKQWYMNYFYPEVPDWANWYGTPGSRFWEIPHIEVREWKRLAANGELALVETPTSDIKRLA